MPVFLCVMCDTMEQFVCVCIVQFFVIYPGEM